ncbi:MAG: hypothetical protein AVDCRST_MAG27-3935, partial [uncultured Craurococcus sp.]
CRIPNRGRLALRAIGMRTGSRPRRRSAAAWPNCSPNIRSVPPSSRSPRISASSRIMPGSWRRWRWRDGA